VRQLRRGIELNL